MLLPSWIVPVFFAVVLVVCVVGITLINRHNSNNLVKEYTKTQNTLYGIAVACVLLFMASKCIGGFA